MLICFVSNHDKVALLWWGAQPIGQIWFGPLQYMVLKSDTYPICCDATQSEQPEWNERNFYFYEKEK